MEQNFGAVHLQSKLTKVGMASMYLSGDEKLWWRTKYNEIQRGRTQVGTRGESKQQQRHRFFPENVEQNA